MVAPEQLDGYGEIATEDQLLLRLQVASHELTLTLTVTVLTSALRFRLPATNKQRGAPM